MGSTAEANVGFGIVSNAKDEWLDTFAHDPALDALADELGLAVAIVGHIEYSGVFIGPKSTLVEGNCWSEFRLNVPSMLAQQTWASEAEIAERINTFIRAAYEYVPEEDREYAKLEDELVSPEDVAWYIFPSYG